MLERTRENLYVRLPAPAPAVPHLRARPARPGERLAPARCEWCGARVRFEWGGGTEPDRVVCMTGGHERFVVRRER